MIAFVHLLPRRRQEKKGTVYLALRDTKDLGSAQNHIAEDLLCYAVFTPLLSSNNHHAICCQKRVAYKEQDVKKGKYQELCPAKWYSDH